MSEEEKKEETHGTSAFSIKLFKLKSTWLIIFGVLFTAISPLFIWATATVSVNLLSSLSVHLTITGQDATNLALDSSNTLKLTYFQFAALALGVFVLLLRIFPLGVTKQVRSMLLILAGAFGVFVPTYFVYTEVAQGQQLISQYQSVANLAKQYLGLQIQYSTTVGIGLILAIIGPILLLIGGFFIRREKA